jgi:hypothetical protein
MPYGTVSGMTSHATKTAAITSITTGLASSAPEVVVVLVDDDVVVAAVLDAPVTVAGLIKGSG